MKKILSKASNKSKLAITLLAFLVVFTPVYYTHAGTNFFEQLLFDIIVNAFGGLMGLCAVILNYAVDEFVVNFGQKFNGGSLFTTVGNLWTIVRDFFNLTFIFGLVYLGFTMILKGDNSNTRRWLVTLVIAALLVNFSLLISKVIIDASNIVATQILNAGLETVNGNGKTVFIRNPNAPTQVGFADSMMVQMGLTTWFGSGSAGTVFDTSSNNDDNKTFMMSMMIMITFVVASFVFLSAGILIIIRGAMLMLFMILSPVMFIGFVLPNFSNVASEYWKQFLGRAFFAPIYILMTYVSLVMAGSVITNVNIARDINAKGIQNTVDLASTFGQFALLIVLLVASLTIAKKLGADGAGKALSVGKTLRNRSIRHTGGVGARTVNRAGELAQRGLQRAGVRNGALYAATGAMQKARIAGSETTAEMRTRRRKINAGVNDEQRRAKREETTSEALRHIQYSTGRQRNAEAQINAGGLTAEQKTHYENQIKEAKEMYEKAQNTLAQNARDAQNDDEVLDILASSQKAVAEKQMSKETYQQLLSSFSDNQFKKITESGKYNNKQIDEMEADRNKGTVSPFTTVLESTTASVTDLEKAIKGFGQTVKSFSAQRLQSVIQGLGPDGVAEIGKRENRHLAANVTDAQLEAFEKDGLFTSSEIDKIKAAREAAYLEIAEKGSLVNQANAAASDAEFQKKQKQALFNRSTQDAGKLPPKLFAAKGMAEFFTPQQLEERLKNGRYSDEDLAAIKKGIEEHHQQLYADNRQNDARRTKNVWEKWGDRSSWGAVVDLDLKDGLANPTAAQMAAFQNAATNAGLGDNA